MNPNRNALNKKLADTMANKIANMPKKLPAKKKAKTIVAQKIEQVKQPTPSQTPAIVTDDNLNKPALNNPVMKAPLIDTEKLGIDTEKEVDVVDQPQKEGKSEKYINPLLEAVDKKSYENPFEQQASIDRVPDAVPFRAGVSDKRDLNKEFNIEQPDISGARSEEETVSSPSGGAQSTQTGAQATPTPQPKREEPPMNAAMVDMTEKEKKLAATLLVDSLIQGYEGLHAVAGQVFSISENKINKMVMEGDIHPTYPIQLSTGVMTAPEIIGEYNQQVKQVLVVSDEFKENIRPPLIRIFTKKGIGMTDEQRVAYLVGADVVTKGVMMVNIKRGINSILGELKAMNEGNKPAAPSGSGQASFTAPATPTSTGEPSEPVREPAPEQPKQPKEQPKDQPKTKPNPNEIQEAIPVDSIPQPEDFQEPEEFIDDINQLNQQ